MMENPALKLGVNIDHVATLRQARGTTYPSVIEAAKLCVTAGAAGITVHLREDRRHIQDHDVIDLRRELSAPLNLEMANAPAIVDIALDVVPEEVCLVPEKRQELTTEGGLDVIGQRDHLTALIARFAAATIDVSLFIDPDPDQVAAAADVGAPIIELHTGTYCDTTDSARRFELERLVSAARQAHALGLRVNAGHGINLMNLAGILEIPHLDTLNIGHSIVAHAVVVGLDAAVRAMRTAMAAYAGGRHE